MNFVLGFIEEILEERQIDCELNKLGKNNL
jgi:hypothetical protein